MKVDAIYENGLHGFVKSVFDCRAVALGLV